MCVTLSYILFPWQTVSTVEVTAIVANTTDQVMQQVTCSFASINWMLSAEPSRLAKKSGLVLEAQVEHAPKRSIFATTSQTDVAAPSSSSHVSYRGGGCFLISSLAPHASVVLTCTYSIRAKRLGLPSPTQNHFTHGPKIAQRLQFHQYHDGNQMRAQSDDAAMSTLEFRCDVTVTAKPHVAGGVAAGFDVDDDLFAVAAQRAESSAGMPLGDEADDEGDYVGDDDDIPRHKGTLIFNQRTVGLAIDLGDLLYPPAMAGGPFSSQFGTADIAQSLSAALFGHSIGLPIAMECIVDIVVPPSTDPREGKTLTMAKAVRRMGTMLGVGEAEHNALPAFIAMVPLAWLSGQGATGQHRHNIGTDYAVDDLISNVLCAGDCAVVGCQPVPGSSGGSSPNRQLRWRALSAHPAVASLVLRHKDFPELCRAITTFF